MSNKTQLQTNNTALDGYISRINAAREVAASLPEAGGSSENESYTVDIYNDIHGFYPIELEAHYNGPHGVVVNVTCISSAHDHTTLGDVSKGLLCIIDPSVSTRMGDSWYSTLGDIQLIFKGPNYALYDIQGNGRIDILYSADNETNPEPEW